MLTGGFVCWGSEQTLPIPLKAEVNALEDGAPVSGDDVLIGKLLGRQRDAFEPECRVSKAEVDAG